MTSNAIMWFRQDLRTSDNAALLAATKNHRVLPIYIWDTSCPKHYQPGAASRWWLHHSLCSLSSSIEDRLHVFSGEPQEILNELIKQHDIDAVYWNRCYEPWQIKRDQRIKKELLKNGVNAQSFNSHLLWEPWEISKADGTPYKVFTPFFKRGCLTATPPRKPQKKPSTPVYFAPSKNNTIDTLNLLPTKNWHTKFEAHWTPGEKFAQQTLTRFIKNSVLEYKLARDIPAMQATSRLSPHLHFGEISPHQVWHKAKDTVAHDLENENLYSFLSELGWREFSYSLLYHFPQLPKKNWKPKFDSFQWENNPSLLRRWQRGQTGIPFVDAGMRELWQTGFMHNRVRMVASSFLVKNCLIDWRKGERWFWDCLVDADLASNVQGWQWVAGSGADAAPFFRIFNPVTQGKRFDENGQYIRHYVPELAALPTKYLFCPWEAPTEVLQKAGIILSKNYPLPIIDLKQSRTRALEVHKNCR